LDAPFRIPKASELIARQLRARILRGELKAGENLPQENELLETFHVSRPTLREAFRILESERLISVSRGARGGAAIHQPDVQVAARYFGFLLQAQKVTFDDVYQTLSFIEPTAARWLAEQKGRQATVDLLRSSLESIKESLHDNEKYSADITNFHQILVSETKVKTLTLMMEMIHNIIETYYARVSIAAGQRMDNLESKRRGYKARERLVKLIEAGEGDQAESFWRDFLDASHKIMLRWQPSDRIVDLSEMI
jgi:DNA-binding FadR family transcriptional regulator